MKQIILRTLLIILCLILIDVTLKSHSPKNKVITKDRLSQLH